VREELDSKANKLEMLTLSSILVTSARIASVNWMLSAGNKSKAAETLEATVVAAGARDVELLIL
jgi:hypothetical protein